MLNLADLNCWYDRIHQMGIWKPEKSLHEIILASVLTKSKFYSFYFHIFAFFKKWLIWGSEGVFTFALYYFMRGYML